jgi:hypothetical protein
MIRPQGFSRSRRRWRTPPPREVSSAAETDRVCSEEAPSAPAMDNATEPTINIAAIEQRYPQLRNAL